MLIEAPSTLRWRNLKTELYFSGQAFRPHQSGEIVHRLNGAFRKRSGNGGIYLKTELCVLASTENILKTELFENDDVTMIRWSARVFLNLVPRAFSSTIFKMRSAILKIVEEKALGTRLESSSNTNPKWRPKWREQQSG